MDGALWQRLVAESGWADERFAAWLGRLWTSQLVKAGPSDEHEVDFSSPTIPRGRVFARYTTGRVRSTEGANPPRNLSGARTVRVRQLWSIRQRRRQRGRRPNDPSSTGSLTLTDHQSLADLDAVLPFVERHIGPSDQATATMLSRLGYENLDELMYAALPDGIRAAADLDLPTAVSEEAAARELRELAARNQPREAMIGLGYHGTITPPVIRRNVLEDPSWYTAYTPYQPEISQGRLEALLNFQTVIGDLTGLPTANASLLDEGTAAAEAMTLVRRANRKASGPFVVDADALPQTIEAGPHPGRGDGHRGGRGGPDRRVARG